MKKYTHTKRKNRKTHKIGGNADLLQKTQSFSMDSSLVQPSLKESATILPNIPANENINSSSSEISTTQIEGIPLSTTSYDANMQLIQDCSRDLPDISSVPNNTPVQELQEKYIAALKCSNEKKQKWLAYKKMLMDKLEQLEKANDAALSSNDDSAAQVAIGVKASNDLNQFKKTAVPDIDVIDNAIGQLVDSENKIYRELKYKLPKLKRKRVVAIVESQTGISSANTKKGLLTDRFDQSAEVAINVAQQSSIIPMIVATTGIVLSGGSALAVSIMIIHTGGVACIGLGIFIGTMILNSWYIDEYMKFVYDLQNTISQSFNRMRIHTVVINDLLRQYDINHRIFGSDDVPCDELEDFLLINMYFYLVFFMYINSTVYNETFKKSAESTRQNKYDKDSKNKIIKDMTEIRSEYESSGITKTTTDKLLAGIQKRFEQIKRLGSATYRSLSINTIQKNLRLIIDMILLTYTMLLSKYTEDYNIALLYLLSKGVTIDTIDKLIFIKGIDLLNDMEIKEVPKSDADIAKDLEPVIESISSVDAEEVERLSVVNPIQNTNSRIPTTAYSQPTRTPPAPGSSAPKPRTFLQRMFGVRGGGNYTNVLKNIKIIKPTLNDRCFASFKNDISKIEQLYGGLIRKTPKSKTMKKRNKKYSKRYRQN